ncbi:hypothetical protein ABZ281_00810 [Streptomyces sp. NPDC006265]|uniref:hypothetical protein n=1 Tax=Streptomyces sp. NPDC006265 TaxID=3156740 RepID=UPI0033B90721
MSAADDLWEKLEKLGFEKEEKPDGFMPQLPADITSLDDRQLMTLYGEYVSWTAYAAMRLVEARTNVRAAKQNLDYSSARAALAASTEKTVAGRKAAAAADDHVQEDEKRHLDAVALAEGLEMVHKNAEARAQFCSRDLSRRQNSTADSRYSKWGT